MGFSARFGIKFRSRFLVANAVAAKQTEKYSPTHDVSLNRSGCGGLRAVYHFFLGVILSTATFGACIAPAAEFDYQQGTSKTSVASQISQSSTIRELFEQGETALRSENLDAAESAFGHVLSVDPDSGAAYAKLGIISMRRKQWHQAINRLEKAQLLTPSVPEICLNLSLAYYQAGDAGSAIPLLESFVRAHPDSMQTLYLMGLCYFSVGRYSEAISVLESIWQQKAEDQDYLFVLGFSASEVGNVEMERRARDRFIKIGHSSAEYHLRAGGVFFAQKQYDRAIVEYQQAAQSNPNFPLVHSNLGLAYFQQTNFQKAEEEFLTDIAIEPNLAVNYERLGEVYFYLNKNERARNSFLEAIRREPQLASSYFGLARLYHQEQKYGLALDAIDDAEKIDPDDPRFHFLKGQILTRMGNTQAGESELNTVNRLLTAERARRQGLNGENLPPPQIRTVPEPQ
jgi:tetratricopeptide (TPR) repeat protein